MTVCNQFIETKTAGYGLVNIMSLWKKTKVILRTYVYPLESGESAGVCARWWAAARAGRAGGAPAGGGGAARRGALPARRGRRRRRGARRAPSRAGARPPPGGASGGARSRTPRYPPAASALLSLAWQQHTSSTSILQLSLTILLSLNLSCMEYITLYVFHAIENRLIERKQEQYLFWQQNKVMENKKVPQQFYKV